MISTLMAMILAVQVPPAPTNLRIATEGCDRYNEPCVELNSGSEWREVWQQLPRSGGVILIMPGEHQVTETPYISNLEYAKVIGVTSPDGERPRLYSAEASPVGTAIPWGGTNGDLTVENLRIDHFTTNCIYTGGGQNTATQQTITMRDVEISYCGGKALMFAYEPVGGPYDDVFVCDGCEFHTVRETHVLYVDRIREARITNSKFYNAGSLHPFKVIAGEIYVVGNEISNGLLDGSGFRPPDGDWILRGKAIEGTSSMSLVACQKGIVSGNTIRYVFKNTGHHAADRQPRHAIQGCDVDAADFSAATYYPVPPDAGATKFWSDSFWNSVRAPGLETAEQIANNPHAFPFFWSDNHFILTVLEGNPSVPVIVSNKGTYPNEPVQEGSSNVVALEPVPTGWTVRSFDLFVNNCFEGFSDPLYLNGSHVDREGNTVEGSVAVRERWIGSNECGVTDPVPAWFRTP